MTSHKLFSNQVIVVVNFENFFISPTKTINQEVVTYCVLLSPNIRWMLHFSREKTCGPKIAKILCTEAS